MPCAYKALSSVLEIKGRHWMQILRSSALVAVSAGHALSLERKERARWIGINLERQPGGGDLKAILLM